MRGFVVLSKLESRLGVTELEALTCGSDPKQQFESYLETLATLT